MRRRFGVMAVGAALVAAALAATGAAQDVGLSGGSDRAAGARDVPADSELLASADEAGGVYSGAGPDDCLLFAADELGASAVCRGAFGFNLIIHDSDGRIFLGLAHPDWTATARIDPTPVAPGFSWLPVDVVEWRVADGAPYALIVLLGLQDAEDDVRTQAVLVICVAPDDPEATCLVAAVPASADLDAQARAAAAQARDTECL